MKEKQKLPIQGRLNVSFKSSDIHRNTAIYAMAHEQSLNSFIEEAVEERHKMVKHNGYDEEIC